MIPYEYQILRFIPDYSGEEFVNVGVVVYSKTPLLLKSKFINRIGRVSSFFHGINTKYIMQSINHLDNEILNLNSKLDTNLNLVFDIPDGIAEITSNLLPRDDSSLSFSEVKQGVDSDPETALSYLTQEILYKYEHADDTKEIRNDGEVWSKFYKQLFEKNEITPHLQNYTVKTANDKIEFQHAWKNEKWHCFQPISFDLKKEDSVKNKVYRWMGKIQEIGNSTEELEIQLLALMPRKRKLKDFIVKMLQDKSVGTATSKLVDQSNAKRFVEDLRQEIESHT